MCNLNFTIYKNDSKKGLDEAFTLGIVPKNTITQTSIGKLITNRTSNRIYMVIKPCLLRLDTILDTTLTFIFPSFDCAKIMRYIGIKLLYNVYGT